MELGNKISLKKGTDDGTRQVEDCGRGPPGWSGSRPTPAETEELEASSQSLMKGGRFRVWAAQSVALDLMGMLNSKA